ncbi:hypothetical protein BDM02DRAFT_940583 [Thelephora ganbajun]|uniref:Uncharacterized protein n=1 Tax=Thelephora ganbajun TaxID=370292 RepID=A0ACB6Z436_THEGA|nr:hypothetical protein BDM02DRAFT_940583 [Thelephora ganbajun]
MLYELLKTLQQELEPVVQSLPGGYYTLLDCDQREDLRKAGMDVLNNLPRLTNALAPVNRLPPEILGTIPKYREQDEDRMRVVTLSNVCSYWRNTFIAMPSLWTEFNGRDAEMSRISIERSGVLPIQLVVEGAPDPGVLELLAPHFPRLDVVSFDLSVLGRGGPDTQVVPMHGEFPSLERLQLKDLQLSINDVRTPKLRVLKLTRTYDFANLLDFLETCPLLENLELRLHHLNGEPPGARRKVVWDNLKTIVLCGHGLKILQHTSLPPGVEAGLYGPMILRDLTGHRNDGNLFNLQAWTHLPMFRQSESLSLRIASTYQLISLKGPGGNMGLKTRFHPHLNCVGLLIQFTRPSVDTIQNLEIDGVRLSGENAAVFEVVSDLLRPLHGLRSLKLVHTTPSPWIQVLDQNYCPRLWNLTLWESPPPSCEDLIRFVMGRSGAGVPISRLSLTKDIQKFFYTREDVERLEKYVRCVEWDPK